MVLQPNQTTRTTLPSDLSARRTEPFRPLPAGHIPDSALEATGVKPEPFRRWLKTAKGQENPPPLLLARFVNDMMVASLTEQDELGPLEMPYIDFSKLGLQPAEAQILQERYINWFVNMIPDFRPSFTKLVQYGLVWRRYEVWQEQYFCMSNGKP
ncbi:hypothetical protein WJX74_007966 [Apatococcus lobatus]|uniref:Uncharacterized protein n=2 Tax=Apatococcus TaxID=904362 RepID=A0AAW1SYV8_9CHLO